MRHSSVPTFAWTRVGLPAVIGAWVIALVAVPLAQAPAGRAMVPMAASSIAMFPDKYYGELVSIIAAVETTLSKTAFTVDQDKTKATGKEILVLAPTMNGVVIPNQYVTVQGEVVKFDPAAIAQKAKTYRLDLDPEVVARFQGRPAILATAVINSSLIDVAKRVLPPPTPEELALDKAMKQISPTFNDLRTGLETPKADDVKAQVATLKAAFTETEAFFKKRGTADATGWAQEALKFVASMEAGAAGAKWEEVRTAATGLAGLCQTCHGAHRERQDDGSFRVRPAGGGY